MPSNQIQFEAFTRTRVQQIARLATLQRDPAREFNALERQIIQRAIFSMVMDCGAAGVDHAVMDAALTGSVSDPLQE